MSLTAAPVLAQSGDQSNSINLQDALRRIASNSADSSALADAGLAALDLGDTRAAIGFLARADEIFPRSGRVKAGLARALLLEQNPFGAIRYFDEAIANGISVKEIALDRGLAYDLIGRNADAQKDYALAMRYEQSDLLLGRYAVSLGISGDVAGAEAKLNPLLQKSDRDAWRNRAFIFAMNGDEKEANKIARQTMTKQMAKAIKPFFDGMPKLTAAQKAAAVHFGHFPASENIGVDVASVRFASQSAMRGGDGADAGLIPIGEPLGQDAKKPKVLAMPDTSSRRRPGATRKEKKKQQNASLAKSDTAVRLAQNTLPVPAIARPLVKPNVNRPSDPIATKAAVIEKPALVPAPVSSPGFETAIGGATEQAERQIAMSPPEIGAPAPSLVSESVSRKVNIGDVKAVGQSTDEELNAPVQLVDFDLAKAGGSGPSPIISGNVEGSGGGAPPPRALSEIIGSISIPDSEKRTGVVPVDLASITPAKPKPPVEKPVEEKAEPKKVEAKAKPKPKPPEFPKRYWVQIATGSDIKALKYDYRRLAKKNAELFAGISGWTSPWGQTRRLVIGPFDDFKTAKKIEAEYRKNGGDAFAWVSDDGTEVNKLN
ncbi:MAG: SPOR domain-containing protein [Parasphingorhabdus sp.]|uniref:SPOR domain-containing protein n=1 Tax=Parasphingorhabdus sp. TaxID=2709688 RepID=UPI0030037B87